MTYSLWQCLIGLTFIVLIQSVVISLLVFKVILPMAKDFDKRTGKKLL